MDHRCFVWTQFLFGFDLCLLDSSLVAKVFYDMQYFIFDNEKLFLKSNLYQIVLLYEHSRWKNVATYGLDGTPFIIYSYVTKYMFNQEYSGDDDALKKYTRIAVY